MIASFLKYGASVALAASIVAYACTAGAYTANVNTTSNDYNSGHCSLNEAQSLFWKDGNPTGTCFWAADGQNTYKIQLIGGTYTNIYVNMGNFTLNGAGASNTTLLVNNQYTPGVDFIDGNGTVSNLTIKGQGQTANTPAPGAQCENVATSCTLTSVTITGFTGGGINVWPDGTLTLNASTVTSNTTVNQADGAGWGGGIINGGTATINSSTISHNSAAQGAGGIYNSNANVLTIHGSTISNNTANGPGGGLFDLDGGYVTIDTSIINNNTAPSGGGIYESGGTHMYYSTIANNTATSGAGGGIYIGGRNNPYWIGWHVTITGNKAASGTCGVGGGVYVDPSSIQSEDWNASIITGNTNSRNHNEDDLVGKLHDSSLLTDGVNPSIVGSTTCVVNYGKGGLPDQTKSASAVFGNNQLASNGGPTQTVALASNSPAIDACTNTMSNLGGYGGMPANQDQRGSHAPNGKQYDIGSFEH